MEIQLDLKPQAVSSTEVPISSLVYENSNNNNEVPYADVVGSINIATSSKSNNHSTPLKDLVGTGTLNSSEMNAIRVLIGRSKSAANTPNSTNSTPNTPSANVGPTVTRTFYSPNNRPSNASTIQNDSSRVKKTNLFKKEEEKNNNDEESCITNLPPTFQIEVVKKHGKKNHNDSMSLQDEEDNDDSSLEAENFTKFHKKTQDAHERGKYNSLAQAHIFSINNYCKDSLWRRAKFIKDRQLGSEFHNICKHLNIKPEENHDKYVDICMLVNTNMNY
jgi:hypothetical protein